MISGVSPAMFARRVKTSRTTIHRYIQGTRRPCRIIMQRIADATDGQVTESDFRPANDEEDDAGERIFPWTRMNEEQKASQDRAFDAMMQEPLEGHGPSHVIKTIHAILGNRVTKRHGLYYLDGRRVSLVMLIRKTNRHLIARGLKPLAYPGILRPDDLEA
ncbi:MAG TPA: hypothetical protein DCM28_01915 [Phycisphaerales bacterium]|nr:hypothetical protein [Phycisphaerales bacterium]